MIEIITKILLLGGATGYGLLILYLSYRFYHSFRHWKAGDEALWSKLEFIFAVNQIRTWQHEGRIKDTEYIWPHVAHLLGFWTVDHLMTAWNHKTLRTLEMLSGPHGWTIYQVLRKRHHVSQT